MTGLADHLVLIGEAVIGCSGQLESNLQGADQARSESFGTAQSHSEEFSDEVNTPTLPLCNPNNRPYHYYVHIPNGDDSTYQPSKRHFPIDPNFQSHLQEEQEAGNISTFLALPEIILVRKRKHQQSLLDSQNPRFSLLVRTLKVVNMCWHRGRPLKMKPSAKQQKEKLIKRLEERRRKNE